MSFSLTTAQIRARTKSVTRRLSSNLKPGEHFCAIVKGQGLKKGEKVERICELVCISNDREPLSAITKDPIFGRGECRREGFPDMTPPEFVDMFCRYNGCQPTQIVHRINFSYA